MEVKITCCATGSRMPSMVLVWNTGIVTAAIKRVYKVELVKEDLQHQLYWLVSYQKEVETVAEVEVIVY